MSKSKTKPKPLAVETVPIDSIHVDPANVRRHPERNLATIRASLARFGQQKPARRFPMTPDSTSPHHGQTRKGQ